MHPAARGPEQHGPPGGRAPLAKLGPPLVSAQAPEGRGRGAAPRYGSATSSTPPARGRAARPPPALRPPGTRGPREGGETPGGRHLPRGVASPRPRAPRARSPLASAPSPLPARAGSAPLARLPAGVTSPSPAPGYKYWRRPHRLPTLSGSWFRCRVSLSSASSAFSHPLSLSSSVCGVATPSPLPARPSPSSSCPRWGPVSLRRPPPPLLPSWCRGRAFPPTSSPQLMAQAALGISAQGNHIPL